jgi:hypothetical protein
MEFVPVQSYYKATLAQLFDNEGEVKWNSDRLKDEINIRPELVGKLKETGYQKTSKSFTAQQVQFIFEYISRPILNEKNMRLLKINQFDLLDYHKNTKPIETMEQISRLTDAILSSLGLVKSFDKEANTHYLFNGNTNVYLLKIKDGFEIHDLQTFRLIETVKTTEGLIRSLLALRNI